MNQLSPHHKLAHESQMSEMIEQQKLIEGQMQLEDEAESRARRIKMRHQHQVKLAAMHKAKRRARILKFAGFLTVAIAGFWAAVIFGGFFSLMWVSAAVMN